MALAFRTVHHMAFVTFKSFTQILVLTPTSCCGSLPCFFFKPHRTVPSRCGHIFLRFCVQVMELVSLVEPIFFTLEEVTTFLLHSITLNCKQKGSGSQKVILLLDMLSAQSKQWDTGS